MYNVQKILNVQKTFKKILYSLHKKQFKETV